MRHRCLSALSGAAALALCFAWAAPGFAQATRTPSATVQVGDLKQWLAYLASDQLQGRQVYTEGLGLAAAYIAEHLREWGVKPAGDHGGYFQTVSVHGVNTRSRSSVTVTVNGETRTFVDGQGVRFARNQGGKQTIAGQLAFVGYGITLPDGSHDDYRGKNVAGRVAVYLGRGPAGAVNQTRIVNGRGRNALELHRAVAAIGPMTPLPAPAANSPNRGDFQTVERLDAPLPPAIAVDDEFFAFVFEAAGRDYAELKAMAERREPLPALALDDVSVRITIDADYEIVQTRLTRNVVGTIEGTDARLKDTYVLVGAHYDHIGYRQVPTTAPAAAGNVASYCPGQSRPAARGDDIINNGADDDGSGTVAVMAVAKSFATGPRPKRSLMFIWHAGEEAGLLGSRYMADRPSVPIEKMAAMLNIDMVGRNRCDEASESNKVYLVGSDRISTDLHNANEDANRSLRTPMVLDYEMNDPADPESLYTRSDHYSYAAKGVPAIFYTTGLHRDYHYVTDEIDKIEFAKMARIAQLVYVTSFRVANMRGMPARDNKGPRRGKGATGRL